MNEHLVKAKEYVAKGDEFYAKAAEQMVAAQNDGLTTREIADAVGKSQSWVTTTLQWYLSPESSSTQDSPYAGQADAVNLRKAKQQLRERPEEVLAGLDDEAAAKVADALIKRAETTTPSEFRQNRAKAREATEGLRKAAGSFGTMGAVMHLDQAAEDIGTMIAEGNLTSDHIGLIRAALDRVEQQLTFAIQLVPEEAMQGE